MTDHLQEARDILERVKNSNASEPGTQVALLASIAHALIAIAEQFSRRGEVPDYIRNARDKP